MPGRTFLLPAVFMTAWMLCVMPACSGYDQLLKSDDIDLKYEKAREYYNRGSYSRALPLFKQLLTLYKGTDREEEILFFVAYSHYGQGELLLASALFKNYYTFFPNTDRTLRAHFMSAFCLAQASPKVSLDQTTTRKAIDAFQLFINTWPQSDSVTTANRMIDNLRGKLEAKALRSAGLYYRMRDYRAAATAYENVLKDYPDVENAEQVRFLILRSYAELADRSVLCKQEERYASAMAAFEEFRDAYPDSDRMRTASDIHVRAKRRRTETADACGEATRVRKLARADASLRNKEYERAIRIYASYLAENAGREDLEEPHYNLIRARNRLADSEEFSCRKASLYAGARDEYLAFVNAHPDGRRRGDAEKVYENILRSEHRAQEACDEQP